MWLGFRPVHPTSRHLCRDATVRDRAEKTGTSLLETAPVSPPRALSLRLAAAARVAGGRSGGRPTAPSRCSNTIHNRTCGRKKARNSDSVSWGSWVLRLLASHVLLVLSLSRPTRENATFHDGVRTNFLPAGRVGHPRRRHGPTRGTQGQPSIGHNVVGNVVGASASSPNRSTRPTIRTRETHQTRGRTRPLRHDWQTEHRRLRGEGHRDEAWPVRRAARPWLRESPVRGGMRESRSGAALGTPPAELSSP